jgi:DNA-binding LacI/PurR family transcriptional regulator
LNEQKISIPEDTALISIDNLESSAYTNPPLTTMNVPKTIMGQRAVEMIVNKNTPRNENAINLLLPTTLVERKSC